MSNLKKSTVIAMIFVVSFVGIAQATTNLDDVLVTKYIEELTVVRNLEDVTVATYKVEIVEDDSIWNLVEKGNFTSRYNHHSYIRTSHSFGFSRVDPGTYEIIVVDFGKTPFGQSLTKAEALEKLAELNLDTVSMALLLGLAAQHPTCTYGSSGIVELHSSDKHRGFARNGILTKYDKDDERIMFVDDIDKRGGNSHSDYYFAGVKKISQ